MRRTLLPASKRLCLLLGLAACATSVRFANAAPAENDRRSEAYKSPYSIEYTIPKHELLEDLEHTERGNPKLEAEIPHHEWYSRATLERCSEWGPHPRSYPPPAGLEKRSVKWKRERVIAVASRFIGYGYQHHHVPDWDPPASWPWKKTAVGHNGKGVDCSNFTGFVYNLGFGVHLSGDIKKQSALNQAEVPALRHAVPLHKIDLPDDYDERVKALRTGDLLYIKNGKGDHVSHVVLWVGPIGKSPDGTPLIIDSHGEDVKDSSGVQIPCGIHLRPFRPRSWYHHSASHALRLFTDQGQ